MRWECHIELIMWTDIKSTLLLFSPMGKIIKYSLKSFINHSERDSIQFWTKRKTLEEHSAVVLIGTLASCCLLLKSTHIVPCFLGFFVVVLFLSCVFDPQLYPYLLSLLQSSETKYRQSKPKQWFNELPLSNSFFAEPDTRGSVAPMIKVLTCFDMHEWVLYLCFGIHHYSFYFGKLFWNLQRELN